ncbi:hypothetical protein SLA2020_320360 [Shorea laevis]
MADDEPALTRWTFRDFEIFYDDKFGRKRIPESQHNGEVADRPASNGSSSSSRPMAIYEQYRNQDRGSAHTNGVFSNGIQNGPQKPLFPAFDSAETLTLAEGLSRDIIQGSPDVKWESIKGLENAKCLLKEAVVMPIKYPK